MHDIDLGQVDHRPFCALSYTWMLPDIKPEEQVSRPSPPTPKCDGKDLEIGENLFDFLAYLAPATYYSADSDSDPLLWVDAICINQDDLVERAQQVTLMQQVYSKHLL